MRRYLPWAAVLFSTCAAFAQQDRFGGVLEPLLPAVRKASWLDQFPSGSCLAKLVTEGRLIASRRELQSAARQSGSRVLFTGKPRRAPDWEEFPPLIQPIEFSPGLTAYALFSGRIDLLPVSRLSPSEYFTFHPPKLDDSIPLAFPVPPKAASAAALIVLPDAARKAFVPSKAAVRTARVSHGGARITITAADLDGDGQPEIVRMVYDARDRSCKPAEDECGWPAYYLGILYKGRWVLTAQAEHGQDGMTGF